MVMASDEVRAMRERVDQGAVWHKGCLATGKRVRMGATSEPHLGSGIVGICGGNGDSGCCSLVKLADCEVREKVPRAVIEEPDPAESLGVVSTAWLDPGA